MRLQLLRVPVLARPVAILLVMSTLSSCSTWIPASTKVHLSDPSDADEIEAYDTWGTAAGVSEKVFKASTRHAYYTIERKKKGYLPSYTTIKQEGVNPILAVDGGLALLGAILLFAGGGTKDSEEGEGPTTGQILGPGMIAWGLIGVLFGHKKAFKKSAVLEPMTPLPTHDPELMSLYVEKVGVKVEGGNVETRNFNNLANYQKNLTSTGDVKEKRKVTSTFAVETMESIDISQELNGMLTETGFVDTTNTMFRMSHNANQLDVAVTEWDYNYIYGGAYSFKLTSKWAVKDNLSKETILEHTYTTLSDVIVDDSDNDLYRKGFANALGKAMTSLMGESDFTAAMQDKRKKFQATVDGWAPIVMTPGKYTTQKVSESSKAVATVKTKDGHGSGAFVSTSGYLITNLHVTGQQTEGLEILLADGSKLTGRVERSNPVFDLALVKVEGYKGKALAISSSREVELGETVFAVGTPEDVALGQTLTRGIISSKRVFNEVDYIQTDVSINRGNSGGALLNEGGVLIGVVNAKIIGEGVEGVGFAIPSYYIPEALKVTLN